MLASGITDADRLREVGARRTCDREAQVREKGFVVVLKMIDGEQIVFGANGPICVTTHRVRSAHVSWGSQSVDEIFLEDLSYQALRMSSSPLLLAAATLLNVFGIYAAALGHQTAAAVAIIAAVFFAVWYAITRQQVVVFASSGGRIQLAAKTMPRDTLDWLLLKVLETKDRRLRALSALERRSP